MKDKNIWRITPQVYLQRHSHTAHNKQHLINIFTELLEADNNTTIERNTQPNITVPATIAKLHEVLICLSGHKTEGMNDSKKPITSEIRGSS